MHAIHNPGTRNWTSKRAWTRKPPCISPLPPLHWRKDFADSKVERQEFEILVAHRTQFAVLLAKPNAMLQQLCATSHIHEKRMTRSAFLSVHRTFAQAHWVFLKFDETPEADSIRNLSYFITERGTYMLLWYALLFNVCEFLTANKSLPKPVAQQFLDLRQRWEKCRHMVSHVKPKLFDKENFRILASKRDYETIRSIHESLRLFFISEMGAKKGPFSIV